MAFLSPRIPSFLPAYLFLQAIQAPSAALAQPFAGRFANSSVQDVFFPRTANICSLKTEIYAFFSKTPRAIA